jgi:hypothetical protein
MNSRDCDQCQENTATHVIIRRVPGAEYDEVHAFVCDEETEDYGVCMDDILPDVKSEFPKNEANTIIVLKIDDPTVRYDPTWQGHLGLAAPPEIQCPHRPPLLKVELSQGALTVLDQLWDTWQNARVNQAGTEAVGDAYMSYIQFVREHVDPNWS